MLDRSNPYFSQVALVVRVLPLVAAEPCFALKGGTAINLFVCDFPRLSVDIDLTYLPLDDRDDALGAIEDGLGRIADNIRRVIHGAKVTAAAGEAGRVQRLLDSGGWCEHQGGSLAGAPRQHNACSTNGGKRIRGGAVRVCRNTGARSR